MVFPSGGSHLCSMDESRLLLILIVLIIVLFLGFLYPDSVFLQGVFLWTIVVHILWTVIKFLMDY